MKKIKAILSHIRSDINRRIAWNAKHASEIIEFISKHL